MGAKSVRTRRKGHNGCGCALLILAFVPMLVTIFLATSQSSLSIAAGTLPAREASLLQSVFATAQATPITESVKSLVSVLVVTPDPASAVADAPATGSNATANRVANLRQGPGTEYAILGTAQVGQSLTLTGRNDAGDWYQLDTGAWIAAFLVNNAPTALPLVSK
jgi:uncharacterized protein YgiM (DUF1202 family)